MTAKLEIGSNRLLFDGYLKYHSYEVSFEGAKYQGGYIHGPGHEVAIVAAIVFDDKANPNLVFKGGDTRFSRKERGEPYLMTNLIAGRLDHKNTGAREIAIAELKEEVGASLLDGLILPLGDKPVPSTPFESTECDHYFLAAVVLRGKPTGDGGAMELVELLHPQVLTPKEAILASDTGQLAEGGRTRTLIGRAFSKIGWLSHLNSYVWDHPKLIAHFSSLGIKDPFDPRTVPDKASLKGVNHQRFHLKSSIDDALIHSRELIALDEEHKIVAAKIQHAKNCDEQKTAIGQVFSSEYLSCTYDRAKVAVYYLDPDLGPLVSFKAKVQPCLAFAPSSPNIRRLDIEDLKLERDLNPLEQIDSALAGEIMMLDAKTSASGGQCDLYYYYAACWRVKKDDSFIPIAEAISACRQGQGDTHTEAVLQRLAQRLEWIPELGMSYTQVGQLI